MVATLHVALENGSRMNLIRPHHGQIRTSQELAVGFSARIDDQNGRADTEHG